MSARLTLQEYGEINQSGLQILRSIVDICERRARVLERSNATPLGCFEGFEAKYDVWCVQTCETLLRQLRSTMADLTLFKNKLRERKVPLDLDAFIQQDYHKKLQLLEPIDCVGQFQPGEAIIVFRGILDTWPLAQLPSVKDLDVIREKA